MIKIAPSILSADFSCLGDAVEQAEAAGADYIHVDVMDGHFVPNLTIGPPVVKALRKVTKLPLDVHLMIEAPERFLDDFASAGADILTVHVETSPHLQRTVERIKELGVKAGVTLNPATPLVSLEEILSYVDQVLIMSVSPGFGGQSYIPTSTDKIRRLRAMLAAAGAQAAVEVDGGIDVETAPEAVRAGARVLVAGTAIFHYEAGVQAAIAALRSAAERALPATGGSEG